VSYPNAFHGTAAQVATTRGLHGESGPRADRAGQTSIVIDCANWRIPAATYPPSTVPSTRDQRVSPGTALSETCAYLRWLTGSPRPWHRAEATRSAACAAGPSLALHDLAAGRTFESPLLAGPHLSPALCRPRRCVCNHPSHNVFGATPTVSNMWYVIIQERSSGQAFRSLASFCVTHARSVHGTSP